jgi:hypothetical protein
MMIIKKIRQAKKRKDVEACPAPESGKEGRNGLFNLLKVKTDIKAGNICIEQCEARAPGAQYAENCVSGCELTGLA